MNGCPRGALLSAVLLIGLVGCGSPTESEKSQSAARVTRQELGSDPDFVVTKVTAPSSATPGSMFQTTVEVCNRGGSGSGVDVSLYFSDDDVISSTDFWASDFYVGYLSPGECQSQTVAITASVPTDGAWYVGGDADPYGSLFESDETNNSLASQPMGIGYAPDFAVTSVTGPASAQPGQPITAQVTVCNRGTQPGSTNVEVYLSEDDAIHANGPSGPSEDSFVGSGYTDYLYPNQCATVPVNGNAYAPPPGFDGPYYLGAVANPNGTQPELMDGNNALAGYRMGVGNKPDFVITKVTGPASAQPGQPITAQVTVCNHGTQADSTDVEVYLSEDDAIHANGPSGPSEDSYVGSGYTDYLYPNQCTTVSVNGSAYVPPPGFDGPYFLGGVVDPHEYRSELIEDNNDLAGYRMGVGNKPDFVITSVTGPASAQPGQPITAQVTVCNHGTQPDMTDVDVYLSADDAIHANGPSGPSEDSYVGAASTGYLYPNQCATVPVNGNAYAPPPGFDGPYYMGAVVDPNGYEPELIEDNNTLAGYRMGVGNKPDFVVTSVTGPASAQPGHPITVQVTVCNRGTQADMTDVDVYLSADDAIHANGLSGPSEDSYVGAVSTGYLYPNQCATLPVNGNAYTPPPGFDGPYFVGAVIDPNGYEQELIEDNNTLAGYRMGVGNKPDFVVTSVTGPASAQPGQSITAQVTVCNHGTQADSTDVEVYLSADDVIHGWGSYGPPEDSLVGTATTSYLYPNQCTTVPVSGYAYAPPPGFDGPYFMGALVDPHGNRPELIEDNNSSAGYRMGVGNRPDFVVTSVTGPASAKSGDSITTQVTVCNHGTQPDSTDLEVYLSADSIIHAYGYPFPGPPEDSLVGTAATGYLYPNQCATVPVNGNAYAPPPGFDGPYFVGVVVDPYGNRTELIEDNNTLAGYRMGVGNRPDFVITSVTGPASAQPGQPITAQVTVCNNGTQPDMTDVDVYLSADDAIHPNGPPGPPEDSYVGAASTGYLYPSQCATVPVSGNAYAPPPGYDGPYFVGAVIDPNGYEPELIEDNNTLAGYQMGLGNKPDFVVTSVTGPASAKSGDSITTQVTICNRGTQADSTDVEVYLSADDAIHGWSSYGPPEDSLVGTATTSYLYPNQCTTVPVSGYAYAPPPGYDGPFFVGALVDPHGNRPELIEDNNALAGYRMGLGNKPDFVITSVTGPYSAQPGSSATLSVGVCNRGQSMDTVDVELYLSADTNVQVPVPPGPPEDFFLGAVSGISLAAGGCTTRNVSVTMPSVPEGAYYLSGVADPHGNRSELIEDNNAKAGNVIGVGTKSDFVVTTVTGPNSVKVGVTFTASVTVCNRGQMTDTADVGVYLSADSNIRVPTPPGPPEDFFLGTVSSGSLTAGACATRSLSVTAPSVPEGAYFLGGVADPNNMRPELIENNNTLAGNRIGVGNKPDFVVTTVTGPASVKLGAAFSASVTVCNRGQLADTTDVDLYFSADSNINVPTPPMPPEDFYLGTLKGVSLAVGACSTRSITVNAYAPSTGSYYLGTVADAANARPELIEDNNTKAGTFMSVIP